MAVHDEQCYRTLVEAEKGADERERKLVKSFWAGLGEDLAGSWQLPSKMSQHLEGAKAAWDPSVSWGQTLTRLSNAFARAVLDRDGPQSELAEMGSLERHCGLPTVEVLEQARISLQRTARFAPVFRRTMEGVRLGGGLREPVLSSEAEPLPGVEAAQGQGPAGGVPSQESLFLDLMTQLSESLVQANLSLDEMYLLVVEILYRGVGLDRVLLCMLTRDRKALTLRYGVGDDVEDLRARLSLSFPPQTALLTSAFEQASETLGTVKDIPDPAEKSPFFASAPRGGMTWPRPDRGLILGCASA